MAVEFTDGNRNEEKFADERGVAWREKIERTRHMCFDWPPIYATLQRGFPGIGMADAGQSTPTDQSEQLEGIGGWLILPIIHLLLNGGTILFSLGQGFVKGFAQGWNAEQSKAAAAASHDAASQVIAPAQVNLTFPEQCSALFAFFCLCIVLYALFVLLRFFQKRRSVPRLMIAFYLLLLTMTAINLYLLRTFPELQATPSDMGDAVMGIVRVVVAVLIWIPYFLVSVRVKNTFVH
jgi:hypothetical protein